MFESGLRPQNVFGPGLRPREVFGSALSWACTVPMGLCFCLGQFTPFPGPAALPRALVSSGQQFLGKEHPGLAGGDQCPALSPLRDFGSLSISSLCVCVCPERGWDPSVTLRVCSLTSTTAPSPNSIFLGHQSLCSSFGRELWHITSFIK